MRSRELQYTELDEQRLLVGALLMVKLGQPSDCDCSTCVGVYPLKINDDLTADRQLYGGFMCLCPCHDAAFAKKKAERDAKDLCPFCHTNSDYQTGCCAKLATVRDCLYVAQESPTNFSVEQLVERLFEVLKC